MVRESGISFTKPIFTSYLLPSLRLPFARARRHSASSLSSEDSPPTSATTTPSTSPPTRETTMTKKSSPKTQLARVAPDTLRCSTCSSDLGFASQIVSKGFTGRYGRAFLVAPPPLPAEQTLLNIRVGKCENRQLVTGWHVVADITCNSCASKLGWKYVDAKEQAQKYKVGKFILETERVMTFRSWEDVQMEHDGAISSKDDKNWDKVESKSGCRVENSEEEQEGEEVVFDSGDEDECDEMFAGVWDPETAAARRRSRRISRSTSKAGGE